MREDGPSGGVEKKLHFLRCHFIPNEAQGSFWNVRSGFMSKGGVSLSAPTGLESTFGAGCHNNKRDWRVRRFGGGFTGS
jgi:hypothetical protein